MGGFFATLLYTVFMLMVTVILLNLLIAMIGDMYTRVQAFAQTELELERAKTLARIERSMTVAVTRGKAMKRLYKAAVPYSDAQGRLAMWATVDDAALAQSPLEDKIDTILGLVKRQAGQIDSLGNITHSLQMSVDKVSSDSTARRQKAAAVIQQTIRKCPRAMGGCGSFMFEA